MYILHKGWHAVVILRVKIIIAVVSWHHIRLHNENRCWRGRFWFRFRGLLWFIPLIEMVLVFFKKNPALEIFILFNNNYKKKKKKESNLRSL
ncbi:hypothetical protein EDC94DRAFT_626856, partial [Helicostylum pulchrum]